MIKSNKGVFEFGDVFYIAVFVIIMVVFSYLFTPLMDILTTATTNMPNASIVLTLMYLLPIVAVGLFIWALSRKAQQQQM